MTEETTAVENTEPTNSGINITVEQILAALISTVGDTTVPLEKLVTNYGDKSIAVNQNEDKSVTFSLVDLKQEEPTE
jgi:hypothetical protein